MPHQNSWGGGNTPKHHASKEGDTACPGSTDRRLEVEDGGNSSRSNKGTVVPRERKFLVGIGVEVKVVHTMCPGLGRI